MSPKKKSAEVLEVGGSEVAEGVFERRMTTLEALSASVLMGLRIGAGFAGMMLFIALWEAFRGRDLGDGWITAVLPAVLVGGLVFFFITAVAGVHYALLGTKTVRPELEE